MATDNDNPFVGVVDGIEEPVETEEESQDDEEREDDSPEAGEDGEDHEDDGEGDTPDPAEDEPEPGAGKKESKPPEGFVPVGVVQELREDRRLLREELKQLREELVAGRKPAEDDDEEEDPFLELRDMTPGQLEDYAQEGEDQRKHVLQYMRTLEREREDRIVSRVSKAPEDQQANAAKQEAARVYQALTDSNDWLQDKEGAAYIVFSRAYEKSEAETHRGALRDAIRQVAPVLRAAGLKLNGLKDADPEFYEELAGAAPKAKRQASDPSVADMRGGSSGRGKQPLKVGLKTPAEKVAKAYREMTPAQREAWLDSTEELDE